MMKDVMMGTFIKDGENVEFTFKTYFTTSEKAQFISAITNVLVGNDYLPVLRNIFFDYYIIDMLTDVDMPIDEKDESIELIDKIENFLEETNVIDIVKANIEDSLIDELNDAIDMNIEYRTGIRKNALNDALSSLVNTLEEKLKDYDIEDAMQMVEAFSGITGDFTPQNIVNAYMNTDIAKQNIKELEESKEKNVKIADEMAKVIDINTADKK